MHVITRKTIKEYAAGHAQVSEELNTWYHLVRLAEWPDFNALRADLPATDYVGNDRYVFNIKGNHYRLIALILFPTKRVYIRGIYTHAEYSKVGPKQIKLL